MAWVWVSLWSVDLGFPGKEEVLRPPLTRRASANNAPFLPTLAQPKLKVPGRCFSYFGYFRHRHRARARPSAAILRTPINLLRQFGKRQSKAKQPRKANTPKKKQKKNREKSESRNFVYFCLELPLFHFICILFSAERILVPKATAARRTQGFAKEEQRERRESKDIQGRKHQTKVNMPPFLFIFFYSYFLSTVKGIARYLMSYTHIHPQSTHSQSTHTHTTRLMGDYMTSSWSFTRNTARINI